MVASLMLHVFISELGCVDGFGLSRGWLWVFLVMGRGRWTIGFCAWVVFMVLGCLGSCGRLVDASVVQLICVEALLA